MAVNQTEQVTPDPAPAPLEADELPEFMVVIYHKWTNSIRRYTIPAENFADAYVYAEEDLQSHERIIGIVDDELRPYV